MSLKLSQERYAYVTWKVSDFFELPRQSDYFIESPHFRLNDDSYCLRLYTNIWEVKIGILQCFVAFDLLRLPSYVSERDVSFKIGYKSITGKEFETKKQLVSLYSGDVFLSIASRSIFENEKETYAPEGTLTVFCRIRLGESFNARKLLSEVRETSFVDHKLASQQDAEHGGLPNPFIDQNGSIATVNPKVYNCRKSEASGETLHHSSGAPSKVPQPSETGVDKLQPEKKKVLEGAESDERIVVSGKEFQVHRNILRACSPVFDAMFGHDTAENGKVVINDLDPDSFRVVLQYVYTGSVETFTNDNVYGVYEAAVKYQLNTLKLECVEYMKKNLSMDSFCDVMNVAQQHSETDLIEKYRVGKPLHHRSGTHSKMPQPSEAGVDKLQPKNNKLQEEVESDACIVVSGKEFQVHMNILRSCSPVFDAIFGHETAENEKVVIDDIDPESFRIVLQYLYTASVETLSNDNVFGVFEVADKYQLSTLKLECVEYMRKNLSVDSFCDVMNFAQQQNETDLMEQVVKFFQKNLSRIVLTLKWQQFMCENCTTAHKLLIKGFHDS